MKTKLFNFGRKDKKLCGDGKRNVLFIIAALLVAFILYICYLDTLWMY